MTSPVTGSRLYVTGEDALVKIAGELVSPDCGCNCWPSAVVPEPPAKMGNVCCGLMPLLVVAGLCDDAEVEPLVVSDILLVTLPLFDTAPVPELVGVIALDDPITGRLKTNVTGLRPAARVLPTSSWKVPSPRGFICNAGYTAPMEVALRLQFSTSMLAVRVHCRGATDASPKAQVETEQAAGSNGLPSAA